MTVAGSAIHFTLGAALGAVLLAMAMFGVLAVKAPKGLKSNDFKLFHVYSEVPNKRELHFLLFFFFGIFPTYMALLGTASLPISEKSILFFT